VCIQAGDQELLLDEARGPAVHLDKSGVDVRRDAFAEMQHTVQTMAGRTPEADDANARLADRLRLAA
jgi:acetyl esterase/lipase